MTTTPSSPTPTSPVDDGGPAYPAKHISKPGLISVAEDALTPRDHFAMTAPITFEMACNSIGKTSVSMLMHIPDMRAEMFEGWARLRYEFADAMIRARKGGDRS